MAKLRPNMAKYGQIWQNLAIFPREFGQIWLNLAKFLYIGTHCRTCTCTCTCTC